MNYPIEILQDELCASMCADIQLRYKTEDLIVIDTPFHFPDGDSYQLYLKSAPGGLLKMTDNGHTLMHLSYENDTIKFKSGTRGSLFSQILSQLEVQEDDGEIFTLTEPLEVSKSIFRISQAITQISDLGFLNRVHAENTFYEDLRDILLRFIDPNIIHEDYIHPSLPEGKDYPIDYFISGSKVDLAIFGIPNKDKAKLSTIILERLNRYDIPFESLLIFHDQSNIPKSDLARLSNIGGEMIASLEAQQDLKRKVLKRVA